MQIRDLAWVVSLAEHGHVTDAAAVLGTSQPTLSRALARVEAEVGGRLFERGPGGIHLNPLGEVVVGAARDVVERWDGLLAEVGSLLDPDRGVVRLAFLDSLATSLVPRLLRSFHHHAPGVRVQLRQEPAHDITRDLATGAADLAVLTVRPAGDVGWLPLQEERLVLVVPPTHRLARRRLVDLTELADEELVTTPPGFGYRALVEGLLAQAGVSPAVSFESADLATIEGLVAAGLGVAVLPEPLAGASGTVPVRLREPAARRTVALCWRLDREVPPAAQRFLDFVGDDVAGALAGGV
jgi:DNA-binding transcriptional LysR family regulator